MKRNRSARRGAVFVEAVVVTSFFVLTFLGIVYFRDLYVKNLRVQRLARAAAMTHAMSACASDTKQAIAADAPGQQPVQTTGSTGQPLTPTGGGGTERGNKALENIQSKKGGMSLNASTSISLSSEAAVSTKKGLLSNREDVFRGPASSTSHVTCADEVRDTQYDGIVDEITSMF